MKERNVPTPPENGVTDNVRPFVPRADPFRSAGLPAQAASSPDNEDDDDPGPAAP